VDVCCWVEYDETERGRMECRWVGGVRVCAKLEYGNPTGSHKDRMAIYMVRGAALEGDLSPGGCVAELSSGNTAAAVAWVSRMLGLKSVLFVEESVSEVKKALIASLGGRVVEVPDDFGVEDAKKRAAEEGCLYLGQHENEYNYLAHYETTGPEVIGQTGGSVDYFVMGVGTGGLIAGVGARLKEDLGHTKVVGVVPAGSPQAGGRGARDGGIEGLAGYKTAALFERHRRVVDDIVEVDPKEAIKGIVDLRDYMGLLAGPSTGAAFKVVQKLLEEEARPGETIVFIVADHLMRYPRVLQELAVRG